jgi:drug/metabolite transporter (DMT)-like permease
MTAAAETPDISRTRRNVRLAVLGMLVCVVIYGSNFALSRHAVINGMTTGDLVVLRFLTSGLILLPLFLAKGGFRDCAGAGWLRGLQVTVMSGLPMTLLMIGGLSLAPAAHGASITPGTVMLVGAIGSIILFGVRPGAALIAGIAVAAAGLVCIGLASTTGGGPDSLTGDLMFLAAGLVWGLYPLMLQHWKMDGLHATAILAVVSMVVFTPWYFAFSASRFWELPWQLTLFHAVNQGVLNVIVGLWIWGWAARVLGADVAGRFPALIPVMGTLTAIPLLGEMPMPLQIIGMALVVAGLALASRRNTARRT